MNTPKRHMRQTAIPIAAILVLGMSPAFAAMNTPAGYRFELAGPPKSEGGGKSLVAIKLIHDGKPAAGAAVTQSRADMGPMGMAAMTAPIKPLGEAPPGTYRFEVTNGPVWNKPDNWAVSFSAKVKDASQPANGSVVVKLAP